MTSKPEEKMSAKIQRYDLYNNDAPVVDPEGVFVLYSDHKAQLDEALEALSNSVRQWEAYCTDMGCEDLENMKHLEATQLRRCKEVLARLERTAK